MIDFGKFGPFDIGDRLLDQYEVLQLLGVGGHAYVYECRDLFLDERLAVKVIPNPPNRGRDLLNRARAEAQLLRRLSHPNVVRVHTAAALSDDMVCLVMEKLDGVSLRHLLVLLGRLSVVEAALIVRQVAIGVAAAHELNVVHRDIKPDNVFVLPPHNQVKVLDFGIAKFLGQGLQTSNRHRFQGTPLYMSPEHLQGAGVTVRSDVYQLGTVLFELLAGINPNLVDLESPDFEQIALAQITRPTPTLSSLIGDVPEQLERLIHRATAKDAAARFASMTEFIEALDRTMRDYVTEHPDESRRVRYVDATLRQAAWALTSQQTASATERRSSTGTVQGIGVKSPGPIGSTLPMVSAFGPTGSPLPLASTFGPTGSPNSEDTSPNGDSGIEQLASYHAVPRVFRNVRRRSSKRHSSNLEASVSPKVAPMRLTIAFVLAALGVGITVGSLILWLARRGNADPAFSRTPLVASTTGPTGSSSATGDFTNAALKSHAGAMPGGGLVHPNAPKEFGAPGLASLPTSAILPASASPLGSRPNVPAAKATLTPATTTLSTSAPAPPLKAAMPLSATDTGSPSDTDLSSEPLDSPSQGRELTGRSLGEDPHH